MIAFQRRARHVSSLLLALGVLSFARAQEPSPPSESRFGPRLVVAGTPVSDEMIQLWIIYGPAREKLEERKVRFLIERELDLRARTIADERVREAAKVQPYASKEAEDAARDGIVRAVKQGFESTTLDVAGAIDEEYKHTLADFTKRFPSLDAQVEMRRSMRSGDWFREQLHWTKVFDRVFLPDDETNRPEATLRALKRHYASDYERFATAWRGADGKVDPQYKIMVRQAVRDELNTEQHFSSSLEGPDFSIALRADVDGDGKPELAIPTAEIWREVEATVANAEIEDARRYWTIVLATRAALERDRIYLSKQARDQAWEALKGELHEFMPTLDALAMQQERFPSTESYREFQGQIKSFRTHIEPEVAPAKDGGLSEAVRADLARAEPRLSGVRVDAEVLLVSAYDFAQAQWKPEGPAGALARARTLADALRANAARWKAHGNRAAPASANEPATEAPDECWKRALDEKSEWWDPPIVTAPGDVSSEFFRKNKGRFGAREWSELAELLELTRYDQWVRGAELADALLSRLPIGEVGGPYSCRYGACLVRVKSRSEPSRPVDIKQPTQRAILELEYVDERFRRYAQAAVEQAERDATAKK